VTHAGFISLEQWVSWATEHISGKVGKLPKVSFLIVYIIILLHFRRNKFYGGNILVSVFPF
jgi:hypothetical protein